MDDLISRQSVIDFINDIEHRALRMSNDNSEDVLYKTVLATAKAIRGYCNLAPPAQQSFEWCHDCKEYDQEAHCCHRWTKTIRKTVDELKQSAQPEPQWIPVAERLPEQGARVLTCSKDGNIWINDYNPIAPTAWAIEPWAVIAWMPLPEPWKG